MSIKRIISLLLAALMLFSLGGAALAADPAERSDGTDGALIEELPDDPAPETGKETAAASETERFSVYEETAAASETDGFSVYHDVVNGIAETQGETVGAASGTCGDNLTWTLTENEDDPVTWGNNTTHAALTLTITGTGAMDKLYVGNRGALV